MGQICNETNAAGCKCPDTTSRHCYLLPDLKVSLKAITDAGGWAEYPQTGAGINYTGQGDDDGRLRVTIATPNIGMGPLHVIGTNSYVCGADTSSNSGACPDGKNPSRVILQRIYKKDSATMSYSDRICGTMTYHPFHGHIHVDDWVLFSLRIKKSTEPNPLKWPIVGQSSKMGYCLLDAAKCSQVPGYCVNNKDSILLDNAFPNSGIGNFKTCDNTLQGISSGAMDAYNMDTYGMWIDIPAETCNGDYYIVVQVDPLNHFTESDETNNVLYTKITLTKQKTSGSSTLKISADKPFTLCENDTLTLTAPAASSYLWNTGDTTQSIKVTQAGTYSVAIVSSCGPSASLPLTVTILPAPAPLQLSGDTVCLNNTATLKSTGIADSVYWYNSISSGKQIFSGDTFISKPLTQSQTFFADNIKIYPGLSLITGKNDSTGPGNYLAGNKYLSFDCIYPFTLKSVTIYAKSAGFNNIGLRDQFGIDIDGRLINFSKGENKITLNLPVPAGKDLQLYLTGNDDSLFVNNNALNYPYDIPGVVSIKTSSQGKSTYPYFYKWEIVTDPFLCHSLRKSVTAVVDPACTVSVGPEIPATIKTSVFPNPFSQSTTIRLEGRIPQEGKYELYLFDVLGKKVKSIDRSSPEFDVQREGLFAGMYFFKIFLRDSVIAKGKLIVE